MKLIKWIFSNIILIVFVLALTYAYVYWDNLTGEDTPAGKAITYLSEEFDEVQEFLQVYTGEDEEERVAQATGDEPGDTEEHVAVVAPPVSVPQVQPPPRRSVPSPEMRPPARPQGPSQARAPEMRPPARPQSPSQARAPELRPPARPQMPQQATAPDMRPPARPQMPQQATAPDMRPPARPQMPQQVPSQARAPESRPIPPAMPAPPVRQESRRQPPPMRQPAAEEAKPSTTREFWVNARKEYHRGNIEESIRNYKEVIARSDNNYDAHGELGNVYLRQGNNKEAAGAYFEAAAILVKLGQNRRARSLLPMLGRLDADRAEALNQLLTSSKTSS